MKDQKLTTSVYVVLYDHESSLNDSYNCQHCFNIWAVIDL